MNIYSVKAYGNYGGGMAVVAAENTERALELVREIRDTVWQTAYEKGEVAMLTERVHCVAKVLDHFETGE